MQLDNYQLIARLAAGGMAELHVARAQTAAGVERIVVVKQLLPEFVANRSYVEMFLDEGRVIAALNHSNVVQLYDMGLHAGLPYLVMEYLRGHTLASLMHRLRTDGKVLSVGHALAIASAICAGLHHAHEARDITGLPLEIVHRDVSPQNVIVTYDGSVKLIDFGIAKATGQIHATQAGLLKGKLHYMAPEQVHTRPVDRRTDVYAVGVVLYELLTLQHPYDLRAYDASSEFSVLQAISSGDVVPLRGVRPDLPVAVEREVVRAMSVAPELRHRDARELQAALDGIARELGVEVQQADRARLIEQIAGPFREPWDAPPAGSPEGGGLDAPTALSTIDSVPYVVSVERGDPRPAPASTRPTRLWIALAGGVVVLVAGLAVVRWLDRPPVVAGAVPSHGPAPGDAMAARLLPDAGAISLGVDPDGAWTAVSSATAADVGAAIDATRDRYLEQVAIRLLADLPPELAVCRGALREPARVARRWLDDVGGFASPERSQLDVVDGPPAVVSARYTLTAEALRRARGFYVRVFSGWRLAFANAAPDREAGVIIVESPDPSAIPLGTILLEVDGEAVHNLGELANHGAATVQLTLRSGSRTWTAKLP